MTKRPRGHQRLGTRRFARTLAATGLATTLLGCNGNTADLGGGPEGREGGTAGGDGGGPVDAQANPLSGKYMGYIESFTFPDGSDVVTMTLTFAASGAVTGTVLRQRCAPRAANGPERRVPAGLV